MCPCTIREQVERLRELEKAQGAMGKDANALRCNTNGRFLLQPSNKT